MFKTQASRLVVAILAGVLILSGQRTPVFAGNDADAAKAWVVANTPVVAAETQQVRTMKPDDPRLPALQKDIKAKTDQTEAYVQSDPTNTPLLTAAADQSFQTGDMQKAQSRTAQALSNAQPGSPEWAAATNEHAKIAEQLGDFKTAMADSLQVMQAFPDNQEAVARYHTNKERTAAAAPSSKAGVAAKKLAASMEEPNLSPGGFGASSNHEEPQALKATAQNVAAAGHLKTAKHLLDMGDGEGALRAAAAAEAASPAFAADARVMQAQAWSVLKDLSKALVQITEAIKLFAQQGRKGDLASAYSQRAAFQNDLNRPGDAVADSNSALENNPKLASAFYERARGNEALGKLDLAGADIDQAASLDPDFMADRDGFHKRHRADAGAGVEGAAPSAWTRLTDAAAGVGFKLVVGSFGGFLLLFAGYVLFFAKEGSPVHLSRFTNRTSVTPTPAAAAVPVPEGASVPINGKYLRGRQIGSGGMGEVFEGHDKDLRRRVAIKRLREELQTRPRERQRFIDEALRVASLHHPHIIEIYDIIQQAEGTYIVFEYVEGRTLHDELNNSSGRHLEPRRALEFLSQVAGALDHAHERGVVHRDIKPSNIMLDEHGRAKVMDFGIARLVIDTMRDINTNTIVGTPTYMAPEQAMGRVGKSMDVYALGISFYEMLTGGLPFKGDDLSAKLENRFTPPSKVLPGLPTAVDDVIKKALDPDPEKRQKTCMQLYEEAAGAFSQVTPMT